MRSVCSTGSSLSPRAAPSSASASLHMARFVVERKTRLVADGGRGIATAHQHIVMIGRESAFDAFLGLVLLPFVVRENASDEDPAGRDQTHLKICHAACASAARWTA